MPTTSRFVRSTFLLGVLATAASAPRALAADQESAPDLLFAQAAQIAKEVDLIRRHYHLAGHSPVTPLEADLLPHHVWQGCYMIMIKTSLFRRQHGLLGFAPAVLEPTARVDAALTWGQTQRVLTELRIARHSLGIPGEVSPAAPVRGKRLLDVYNALQQASADLDALSGDPLSAAPAYAEALRLDEDVNGLLRRTATTDSAVPPPRNLEARPREALEAALVVMGELQRLQRQVGLETTDFSALRRTRDVQPADVFSVVTLCLAELQLIKARLGLVHDITAPARSSEGQTPIEVTQVLGYVAHKLRLIKVQ